LTGGTIADVFATVSTAAVTATVDLSVCRTRAGIGGSPPSWKNKPILEPYIKAYPQLSTSGSTPYWDLESNPNLWLLGFYILSGGSAAAPFFQNGGTNGAWGGVDAWDKVILDDSARGFVLNQVGVYDFQETRNNLIPYLNAFGGGTHVQSPSLVGLQPYIFSKDGSCYSGYPTALGAAQKSRVRLQGDLTASQYSDLLVFGGRLIHYGAKGKQVRA